MKKNERTGNSKRLETALDCQARQDGSKDAVQVSWLDKENWLYFYFQKGQLRLSEYLELREELDSRKSKWLEEKWKELQF